MGGGTDVCAYGDEHIAAGRTDVGWTCVSRDDCTDFQREAEEVGNGVIPIIKCCRSMWNDWCGTLPSERCSYLNVRILASSCALPPYKPHKLPPGVLVALFQSQVSAIESHSHRAIPTPKINGALPTKTPQPPQPKNQPPRRMAIQTNLIV